MVEAAPEAGGGGSGGAAEEKKEEAKAEEEEEEEDDVSACSPFICKPVCRDCSAGKPRLAPSVSLRPCRMPAALWQLHRHILPPPQNAVHPDSIDLCLAFVHGHTIGNRVRPLHLYRVSELLVPANSERC